MTRLTFPSSRFRQVLFAVSVFACFARLGAAQTTVSTSPATNTTWTAAGSPYQVTASITVPAGVTLTVEPGVQVFADSIVTIDIDGALVANGTAASPITFTRSQAAGTWGGLSVTGTTASPSSASLSYVNVSYGGGPTFAADLYVDNINATVTVANSTFTNSARDGIWVNGGNANVSNSTFTNNARYAIKYESAASNPVLAGLSGSANGTDAVAMGGGQMSGNHVWELCGLPYVVTGNQTLQAGATLTIAGGVQVGFLPATSLLIAGTLTATGSPFAPISLIGTTATPGSWGGLLVQGANATATLDSVTIAYGGSFTFAADLYVEGNVDVKRSTFSGSSKDGMWVHSGNANVSDSVFTGNAGYAIKYDSASSNPVLANLTATGNGKNAVAIGGGTMNGVYVWEAAGLPYAVIGSLSVSAGSKLTIEPGVQVTFTAAKLLNVNGTLLASGTAALPISLTGETAAPGFWEGLQIGNSGVPASATLDYVTLAHGGGGCTSCADIYIDRGTVRITKSTIRDSATDGIWLHSGTIGNSIESSQITGNARYGVNNDLTNGNFAFQATNNWWGAASGPTSTCNAGGTGSSVRGAVAVKPFLSAPGADPGPVAPSDTLILSMTPQRWFAPADNIARLFVKLTLRNGNGVPLPGRTLLLNSTLGSVRDGGITDVNGSTFAYITASSPGDAVLTATTDLQTLCEFARSQPSTVTFTADTNPLRPDMEAPYVDGGIKITPEPITRGVLTKIRAKLVNTNAFPISVDATLGFAQSGIGLTFGPIGEVRGKLIAASSEDFIEMDWTPVVSGRYCMQLQYSSVAAASVGPVASSIHALAGGGSGRSQRNLNVSNGPLGSPGDKDSLNKADKAFKLVSKVPSGPTQIQKGLLGKWWGWAKGAASSISQALGGDPPRLDYKTVALAEAKPALSPVTSDSQVSPARAAAMNALNDALLEVIVQGNAASVSLDRAGGAAQAQNLLWNSQQTAALLHYKKAMGNALIAAADKNDAFRQVLTTEGVTSIPVTVADVQAYQQTLSTTGFSAQEINDAHLLGFTDVQIEARKQDLIAADPTTLAGDMMPRLANEAQIMRDLGNTLVNPSNFPASTISFSATIGDSAAQATAPSNKLARVFSNVSTIQVGNPLSTQATIDLKPRVVDLPSDWSVSVSPASVVLDPAQEATITVTITPGAPVPQGIQPRVAIEGYAGTVLLGGVAMDVMVPTAVPFRMSISGDANGDGDVTVSDVFYEINNLFAGGPAPVAGDANGDGAVTVADVFYMINFLFAGGPQPI